MSKLLYHYATGAGLLGMLKDYTKEKPNIKLWASHYMYMNDPQEFKIGQKICTEIIDMIESELRIPKKYRVKTLIDNPIYQTTYNTYIRTTDGQSICPYIISLSGINDSLHMWDMYAAKGNGIVIGFNNSKLLRANILAKDCFYCDINDQTSTSDLIAKIKPYISSLYKSCAKEFPLKKIKEDIKNGFDIPLYQRIHYIHTVICGHIGIRIKNKAYQLEEESRITINRKDTFEILFRDRNGIIIPYTEYSIPFDCVEKIVIGPTADFERVRESILIFLNSKNIEWDIENIIKSKVPYRL
ncbi:MAG: DUF2971 domain-containing protein [Bacteroidales bacterium]|nr:DUF2971 domain-containing protein [Bacteroidales bacterium]